jgi:chromate transporter
VALANHMHRDLVETQGWVSEAEYQDGMAIATICPGPMAYQLGVYCGYVRFGIGGALTVALAFGLAPFLIVIAFAALYTSFSGSWVLRGVFYGVAPVIVALILKASWQLGRKTLKVDRMGWVFAALSAALTVALQRELAVLFIAAGIAGSLWWSRGAEAAKPRATSLMLAAGFPAVQAPALKLFLFFFKTGLLVFGSGLVIAPFLKAYVVDEYHWLTDRQFLDAVAVGMITPGPVVITATFVGYLLDGLAGGLAATAGIFSPSVLLTIVAAPLLRRYRQNPHVKGFVKGVVAAVVGALLGTTVLVARTAIGDMFTAGMALLALLVVLRWAKLPEPLLVLAAAVVGVAAYTASHPAWA